MSNRADVLVVGAGPYGLSLAAHLESRNIPFRIVGEPMGGWKNHMPPGMLLKSQPWASNLASPIGYSIERFYADRHIDYDPVFSYVPLEIFITYGEAYQWRHVGPVEAKKVTSLAPDQCGFLVRFDDGEIAQFGHVVLAIGMVGFKYVPPLPMLDQLPRELVSHSSEYGRFDKLRGKRVVIVGSGSSAIDLAVLLEESDIEVTLVARARKLAWGDPSELRRMSQRLRNPDSGIGPSWPFMVAVYAPWAVHYLPDHLRLRFAYTDGLGPLGGFPMRHRFEPHVRALFDRKITRMKLNNGAVDLHVASSDGENEVVSSDHVIFATGYKVDVGQLGFLDPVMVSKMKMFGSAPRLSWKYESSIPGLHFIGPAAAPSFGPVCRFVHGIRHPARLLSRVFSGGRIRETVNRGEEVNAA